eukprot:gnl/TRDRNA2_/TRDRNA2_172699_c0_seq11.p1 gnl/TRDRNA2_/TRDRNA2_172699_c0~~gnl/TRDRNA2_/TRDRNA2_172699_c0_seq11.p1  ORF type:complete len:239 (-),score=26.07 gnl/TRDRNA2_/TRDRNA2_172699_c0_seq11:68-784(-)
MPLHLVSRAPSPPVPREARDGNNFAFMCVPLRTATFLNALITLVCCFAMVITSIIRTGSIHAGDGQHAWLRVMIGGYSLVSRTAIGCMQVGGVVSATMGIIGTVKLKSHYVKLFNWYQVSRVFGWAIMYAFDLPLLLHCELWRTDAKQAFAEYGWNPIMHDVAMGKNCGMERTRFEWLATSGLILMVYLAYVGFRLFWEHDEPPKYLLRMPKMAVTGSYYTQSFGQRDKPTFNPDVSV